MISRIGIGVLTLVFAASLQAVEFKSVEQLSDVRGSIVYRTYCALCHGPYADGKGRAAKHLTPPPANLTISQTPDSYRESIIRNGGSAVGRSPQMPPWGQELTEEQIKDVLVYLRAINITKPKP